jgi:hypothetical protein
MKFKLIFILLVVAVFVSSRYLFFREGENERFIPLDICEEVSIAKEQQAAQEVKENINIFSTTTETIFGLTSEGTEQVVYRDANDNIGLVTHIHFGAAGKSEAEFYFNGGFISYILKRNLEYTVPITELTYEDIKLVATKEFLMDKERNLCEWYLDGELQVNNVDAQDLVDFLVSNIIE